MTNSQIKLLKTNKKESKGIAVKDSLERLNKRVNTAEEKK